MERKDDVFHMRILFRVFGMRITADDSWPWVCYNAATFLAMLALWLFLIISTFFNDRTDNFFLSLGLILFVFSCCVGYLNLTWRVQTGVNYFALMENLAGPESSTLGREYRLKSDFGDGSSLLRTMSRHWMIIVVTFALICHSLIFIAHGGHPEEVYFDVGKNDAWSLVNFVFLYYNASWLFPVAIVRVLSYLLYRRITALAEYIEENESSLICVPDVMDWYSELYELNKELSRAISPIITQFIVLNLPLLILLLQVNFTVVPLSNLF